MHLKRMPGYWDERRANQTLGLNRMDGPPIPRVASAFREKISMNPAPIELRVARRSECGRICDLRDDVANWLIGKGILQMSYPTQREKVEFQIEARERYVAVIDNRVMGSLRISSHQGSWPDTDSGTFYLSDLFIDREYAGMGAGLSILKEVAGAIVRLGGHRMRLDCWAGNQKLRDFYSAYLSHRWDVPEKDYEVSLYERMIGA